MKNISSAEIREHFSDILNQVSYGKDMIAISRHGKPIAALVPLEIVEFLQKLEDDYDVAEALKSKKDFMKEGGTSWASLKKQLKFK